MLVRPDNLKFFNQPPAMLEVKNKENEVDGYDINDKSESKNLTPNYYKNIIRGKTKSWIDVYVLNKLGQVEDGKPVYESFNDEVHVAKGDVAIAEGVPIFVGIDFGLTLRCICTKN